MIDNPLIEESIAFYVSRLRKRLTAYTDERLKKYGLTDGIFYYLIYIGKYPGCTLSQAAKALGADNGHVTRCVGRLVELGYAHKAQSVTDRRRCHLTLTDTGQSVFCELHTLVLDWDEETSALLSPAEKQELIRLLKKLEHLQGDEVHV